MSNRAKTVISIILVLLLIIVPMICVLVVGAIIPNQYDNTIYYEMGVKYEYLKSIDTPKIVIIGGSSVAFGYNSELISQYMDMPVVNFGLYATLGTKVMLDLAEKYIAEGDIVIIAPEVDAQTYSLYFNGTAMLQCLESNKSMALDIKIENYSDLLSGYMDYTSQKYNLYKTSATPDPQNVYNAKNFNMYGDISYDRPYNVMVGMVDENNRIAINKGLLNDEYVDYINTFIKKVYKKGATPYYIFSPLNRSAFDVSTTQATIEEFYSAVLEKIDCRVISSIHDCIMDAEYFYDTNYHLNNVGVLLKTKRLIEDLYRELLMDKSVDIVIPNKPIVPEDEDDGGESISDDTTFLTEDVDGGVKIIGVSTKDYNKATILCQRI